MTAPDKELTMKQRLFVEAYFKTNYNATEAARLAGYGGNNLNRVGHELLQKPHIKAAMEELSRKKIEEVSVSAEYVLRKLVKVVEKADENDNHNATLRGLELLARHLGMFIERTEITGKDGDPIQYEKIEQEAEEFVRSIDRLARRSPDLKVVK